MKTKGIHRVGILVKDFDRAVALYSELLNTTFYPLALAEMSGINAAYCYDVGIEIVSPMPGSSDPMALALAQHIKEHGEGVHGVVFSIDDVEQARAKAEEMGIRVIDKKEVVDPDEVKKHFHGRYSTFIEYFLNPEDILGANVILGQF